MLTERLSERIRELTARGTQLPPTIQDKLADRLAVELDNAVWDAQLADDANIEPFREMIEEARQGPKLPWPSPEDAGVAEHLDPEDLATLREPEHE